MRSPGLDQLGGEWRGEGEKLSSLWVDKAEGVRVERLTSKAELRTSLSERRDLLPLTVEWIPEERIARLTHMNSNLMGSSGFKADHHQREGGKPLDEAPVGDRRPTLSFRESTGETEPMAYVASMVSLERAPLWELLTRIPDDREVVTADLMRGKLRHERMMGSFSPRDDEEPRGLLIDPVNDTRTRWLPDGRETMRTQMVQESVDEAPFRLPSTRVNDDARRLVDDDELLILIDDLKGDDLRCERSRRWRREHKLELISERDSKARFNLCTEERHSSRSD